MKDKHEQLIENTNYSNGIRMRNGIQDSAQTGNGIRGHVIGQENCSANGCINGCAGKGRVEIPVIKEEDVPPRSTFLSDPANLCTLSGAVLSTIALAFIWNDRYYVGMVLNMLANVMDILDGQIARATPGRHPALGVVGAKMDCYSDVVSHCVVPSSLLMQMSSLHPAAICVACLWVAVGVFRQAYFEVSGRLDDGECIYGVTSDYMPPLAALALHVFPLAGQYWSCVVLVAFILLMVYGSLTLSLRSRRYAGYDLLYVMVYNTSLTLSCLLLAVYGQHANPNVSIWSFHAISLLVHLLLAYPCYFRFVELNL